MQQARRTLSVKSVPQDPPAVAEGVDEIQALLTLLVARRKCVSVVYNKVPMKLAPHIIYTRHDAPFVDAIVVERDGKPPREVKLGTFKLAGLSAVTGTNTSFVRSPLFEANDPRFADVTIAAIG